MGEAVTTDNGWLDLERKGLSGYGVWVGYGHGKGGYSNKQFFKHATDVVYNKIVPAFKNFIVKELGGDPNRLVIENWERETDMYRLYYIEN